jgi:hypothetical protein
MAARTCDGACGIVGIVERIRARGAAEISIALSQPPKVDTEGLEKLADRFATLGDPTAKPLAVEGPSGEALVPTSPSATVTSGAEAVSTPALRRKLEEGDE